MKTQRNRTPRRLLGLGTLALVGACGPSGTGDKALNGAKGPLVQRSVLIILADTLRADALPAGGAPRERAPYLARFAEQSAVFTAARSTSSWTAPSTASLFTGLYPDAHGVEQGLFLAQQAAESKKVETLNVIPEELDTLPERFAAAGYRTFGFSENPNVTEALAFDAGFEGFRDFPYVGDDALDRELAGLSELLGSQDPSGNEDPWFVYLQLMDPHQPYHERQPHFLEPPLGGQDAFDPKWALQRAQYDSEVSYLDRRVQAICEMLGAESDALILFLADHGEEFGEHGRLGHWSVLYDELLRVPFYLRPPNGTTPWEPGVRETPVSLIDVLPTLAELCGLNGSGPLDGQSLLPLLARVPETERRMANREIFAMRRHPVSHGQTDLTSLLLWNRKVIYDAKLKRLELYELARDPGEQTDLLWLGRGSARALRKALQAFRTRELPVEHEPQPVPPLDEELLRSLGYAEEAAAPPR